MGELPPPTGDVWVFDGIREVWQQAKPSDTKDLPRGRAFHSSTVIITSAESTRDSYCNQSIFIFGGLTRFQETETPDLLHDLWELKLEGEQDARKQVWKKYHQGETSTWPSERFHHFAISMEEDTMLMFGGTLKKSKKYIEDTFIWEFRVSSSTWNRRTYSPANTINASAQVARAIVFNSTGNALFQVRKGRVYTYNQLAWTENTKSIGKSTPAKLVKFAAVSVGSAIIVFAGMEPHTTFLRMRVWRVENIDGNWVWQLLSIPRSSPPVQALASWNVIDDQLVVCGSTSHKWAVFLLQKWSNLTSVLAAATTLAIDIVKDMDTSKSNSSSARQVIQRINDVKMLFDNMNVGLNTGSNSVWQLDLKTNVWWQYPTAGSNRPVFYSASNSIDHELGKMLVTFGGAASSVYTNSETAFSLALNRSDVFVYLIEQRQWKKTVPNGLEEGPDPRVFSALVDTGDGQSMVLFGGATIDVPSLNKLLAPDLRRNTTDFLSILCTIARMKNDVWRLTIGSRGTDRGLQIKWTLLKNKTEGPNAPKARVGHQALRVGNKVVIWGGMHAPFDAILKPDKLSRYHAQLLNCLDDLWIFDLVSLHWTKHKQEPMIRPSTCWTQREFCKPAVAAVGARIVTIFQPGASEQSQCKRPYLLSFMVGYDNKVISQNHTTEALPFRPEFIFSWGDSILAVLQESGSDVQEQKVDLELELKYQDSVYVSEMRPGCEAGYSSSDWANFSCKKCLKGFYSPAGATTCCPCPEGLSTFVLTASNVDNCSCDPSYCIHGRCLIVNVKGRLTAECQCNIGFMGRKCDYPTYFIIAAISIVVFTIVIVSVVLLRQMMKYRKQKMVREVELEVMRRVWTINSSEIHLSERIDNGAPGSYGDVYKARYRDMTVALKKLKLQTREFERDFLKETELMKSMRHENIVLFIGAGKFETNDCPFLVLEYMQNGALTGILRNTDVHLSRKQQLSFCLDAAKGMEFLHSQQPPRIHRDLKSTNLLVSAGWVVKVADFGCARLVKRQGETQSVAKRRYAPLNNAREPLLMADRDLSENVGAALWRAPEIFACEPYGTPADVYSFGIVMWEIVARDIPYNEREFRWMKNVKEAVLAGARPSSPGDIDRSYGDLMKECWAGTPSLRPSFTEVVQRLKRLSQTASGGAGLES
jgi:hypothetical protein